MGPSFFPIRLFVSYDWHSFGVINTVQAHEEHCRGNQKNERISEAHPDVLCPLPAVTGRGNGTGSNQVCGLSTPMGKPFSRKIKSSLLVLPLTVLVNGNFQASLGNGGTMTSLLHNLLWYSYALIFDQEKGIHHKQVRQQIIRMTLPKDGSCRVLEVGGKNYERLREALHYNQGIQATALLQTASGMIEPERTGLSDKIELRHEELTLYRAAPEFDVIFLFEWLGRIPVDRRKNILQYCKMLLKPGGSIVTTATKKASCSCLQAKEITTVLKSANFHTICSRRLTGNLQLITARRPRA